MTNQGGQKFLQNLEIFDKAHTTLFLTELEVFNNKNWKNISKKMAQPAWIIDLKSV